jgi:hypothetical protein
MTSPVKDSVKDCRAIGRLLVREAEDDRAMQARLCRGEAHIAFASVLGRHATAAVAPAI